MRTGYSQHKTIRKNKKNRPERSHIWESVLVFLLIFFNGLAWHACWAWSIGATSRMTNSSGRATRRCKCLTWEVLSVLLISFLHLCTFSPRMHAALIYQLSSAHRASVTGHCASPPLASQSTAPLSDHHKPTTEPVCCSLMGAQKGRVVSPVQAEFFPVLWLFQRSFTADSFAWRVSHNGAIPTRTPSHCYLSLYLLLSLLLI